MANAATLSGNVVNLDVSEEVTFNALMLKSMTGSETSAVNNSGTVCSINVKL